MDNYFLNLIRNEKDLQDISLYLAIPLEHLSQIKAKINNLNSPEHTNDILNECVFIEENLEFLFKEYLLLSIEERNTILYKNTGISYKDNLVNYLNKISIQIYEFEQELFADFEGDCIEPVDWPSKIIFKNQYFLEKPLVNLENHTLLRKKIHIKDFYLGFLFFIPAFIWFVGIPFLEHFSDKTNVIKSFQIDQDRSYKNLFYLYSAIKNNKDKQYNFYSLIKSSSFKIPEGFALLDKNSLADYYQKQYYEYKQIDNNTLSLSLNNLNYINCKYILTKISSLEENITVNEKKIHTEYDICSKSQQNTLIIYIQPIENN